MNAPASFEPPRALLREDKLLLGVTALGLTIEECALFLEKSDSAIFRHRSRLLTDFNAPTIPALIVYAITQGLLSLTTVMKWLEDDAQTEVARFRLAKRAFQRHKPTANQLAELRRLMLADQRSVEPAWRSSEPQGLAAKLMSRLNLSREDVGNPFMLIVAALADLGELQWSGTDSPEGLVTVMRVIGAFTFTITGPATGEVLIGAEGKTRTVRLPAPHPYDAGSAD